VTDDQRTDAKPLRLSGIVTMRTVSAALNASRAASESLRHDCTAVHGAAMVASMTLKPLSYVAVIGGGIGSSSDM